MAQMGHEDPLKQSVIQSVNDQYNALTDLSDRIWAYEEIAFRETRSASDLMAYAKEQGFKVTAGIGGMPTSFIAEYGSGEPVIGILGEFDALPGLSQNSVPHKSPLNEGGAGHGCGHNLFGVASLGAATAIKDLIESGDIQGTVRFYGCPAPPGAFPKLKNITFFMPNQIVFNFFDDNHKLPLNCGPINSNRNQALITWTIIGRFIPVL